MNSALIGESQKRSREIDSINNKLFRIGWIQKDEMSKNRITITDRGNNYSVQLSDLHDESLKNSISALAEMAISKEVEYLENRLKELMSVYVESEEKPCK